MLRKSVLIGLFGMLSVALFCDSALATSNVANEVLCRKYDFSCTLNSYSGWDPYNYFTYVKAGSDGSHHNCTSYAAYMLSLNSPYNEHYFHFHDAQFWDNDAVYYGIPVGTEPHVRDIAQWESNHVAYVEEVHYNSYGNVSWIITSDDNASTPGVTTRQKIYVLGFGGLGWPDHFIYFPNNVSGSGGKPPSMTGVTNGGI